MTAQGPLDGVLLAMHGNMCVGNSAGAPIDLDPEGTIAADVRGLVGPRSVRHACAGISTVNPHTLYMGTHSGSLDARGGVAPSW